MLQPTTPPPKKFFYKMFKDETMKLLLQLFSPAWYQQEFLYSKIRTMIEAFAVAWSTGLVL